MIDVAAVPYGFENSIGKTKCQNVLDGFFPQIVVDAVDLLLARAAQELLVERPGRFKVMPAWFLYDYSPPMMISAFIHHADCGKLFDDRAKELRGCRQIEKEILVGRMIFVQLIEGGFEFRIEVLVVEFGRDVIKSLSEPLPDFRVTLPACVPADIFRQ